MADGYKYYITSILTIDAIHDYNDEIEALRRVHNLFDTEDDAREALNDLKLYIANKQ